VEHKVGGIVQQGVIIPDSPLPEGARVEVIWNPTVPAVPPGLDEEWQAWYRASDQALALVDRLAQEMARREEG
jgi:hypothetical protein